MRTIIQVLPAMTGAKAVYLGAEPPESYTLALVAWALVEGEDGSRHVEGMVARGDQVIFADEGHMVELVTYVASGDDEVTEEEIAEAWRNQRGRGS
jgi:hypothetical protein